MGEANVRQRLVSHLSSNPPGLIVATGFAGALNPKLQVGDLVYEDSLSNPRLEKVLKSATARPGKFFSSNRILITPAEKKAARQKTGADLVEMEFAATKELAQKYNIPLIGLRVISDSATEKLPLDFNSLLNADLEIDYSQLVGALFRQPWKIRALLEFRKQLVVAAKNLGSALLKLSQCGD